MKSFCTKSKAIVFGFDWKLLLNGLGLFIKKLWRNAVFCIKSKVIVFGFDWNLLMNILGLFIKKSIEKRYIFAQKARLY